MAITKEYLDKLTIEDLKSLHLELDKKHDDLNTVLEGVKEKLSQKDNDINKLKAEKLDLFLQIPTQKKEENKTEETEEITKTYEDLINEMEG